MSKIGEFQEWKVKDKYPYLTLLEIKLISDRIYSFISRNYEKMK